MNTNQHEGILSFQKGDHIVGLWFSDVPTGDILVVLSRRNMDGEDFWQVTARLRKAVDNKIFDSQDEKESTGFKLPCSKMSEEQAIESTSRVATTLTKHYGGNLFDYYPVNGDVEHFINKIQTAPASWMHLKVVKA